MLEQRAHNGDAVAMRELGRRYRDGAGVDHDWIEAHKWLNLASSWLKDAGRERDAVAQCLTSEQLYRASLAAAKWLATGAER
ncbi:MAG: hypothetical protein EXQ85_07975 [Alphaproteobacteria bacterium]|nr:hypothetical protein [Alphaproteobacteria bacterium]